MNSSGYVCYQIRHTKVCVCAGVLYIDCFDLLQGAGGQRGGRAWPILCLESVYYKVVHRQRSPELGLDTEQTDVLGLSDCHLIAI